MMRTLLPILLAGCATSADGVDLSDDGRPRDTADQADADTDGATTGPVFWLEIEPADDLLPGATLLPQRFGPYLVGDGFDLVLRPAVTVSGTVRAERLTPPWSAAPLPSQTVDVPAQLRFVDESTGAFGITRSDATGVYSAQLVPGLYTLTVVPDTADVPTRHLSTALFSSTQLDLDLGQGVPLWGRVRDGDGAPVPNATVTAVDDAGLASAPSRTDEAGWYEIRVDPGSWRTQIQPPPGVRDPMLIAAPVDVGAEGSRVDGAWSPQQRADLTVRLTQADGAAISGVEVRLTSRLILGYSLGEATYTVEGTSNSQGFVDARVPDGVYRIEVAPDSGQPFAPLVVDDVRVENETDLGTLQLPGFSDLTLQLTDDGGVAVSEAPVRCAEVEGLGRSWNAVSDSTGLLTIRVPSTTLDCVFQPSATRADLAASRQTLAPPFEDPRVVLTPGRPIAGKVTVAIDGSSKAAGLSIVRVLDEDLVPLGYGLTNEQGRFTVRLPDAP